MTHYAPSLQKYPFTGKISSSLGRWFNFKGMIWVAQVDHSPTGDKRIISQVYGKL